MKVAVVDYGMSNIGSVARALAELGSPAVIASKPSQLADVERIVLPGVGSFSDGMAHLIGNGWIEAIRAEVKAGKPLLGICLGMQLLASRGTEGGEHTGLDLIPGEVRRLDEFGCRQRIPHVGWNNICLTGRPSGLFANIPSGTDFYFVHSYAFLAAESGDVLANIEYGVPLSAAISRGHVFGTQFHPEKSSKAGFRLLKNFLQYRSC